MNDSIIEPRDVTILIDSERLTERSQLEALLARIDGHHTDEKPATKFVFRDECAGLVDTGRRCSRPAEDEHIAAALAGYIQLVSENIFNPYIAISTPEVWSTADAFLALVRIPEAHEQLRGKIPLIMELLRPSSSGGYTVEESNLPIPLVTATCVMALAELHNSSLLPNSRKPEVAQFLKGALGHLLDSQAKAGWWSIVGAPPSIMQCDENARVWDTGYVLLSLEHVRRLGFGSERVERAVTLAVAWLLDVYDPDLGWTNAPRLPFRGSAALNTFAHFVLLYACHDIPKDSSWNPSHAIGHVQSLRGPIEGVEELDKHEYRLKGAQGLSLPHPHHINHVAFLLALTQELERSLSESQSVLTADVPWGELFGQVGRSKAVYLFSQVLQGLHLFKPEK